VLFPDTERVLYQETTRDVYEHSRLGWHITYAIKGLFAAQDIQKGTRIMQYIGQKILRKKPQSAYIRQSVHF